MTYPLAINPPVSLRPAADGQRTTGETQFDDRHFALAGMRDANGPATDWRLTEHGQLATQVDQSGLAERGHAIKGRTLPERPRVEGGIRQAGDRARRSLDREVIETRPRPSILHR